MKALAGKAGGDFLQEQEWESSSTAIHAARSRITSQPYTATQNTGGLASSSVAGFLVFLERERNDEH